MFLQTLSGKLASDESSNGDGDQLEHEQKETHLCQQDSGALQCSLFQYFLSEKITDQVIVC